LSFKSWDRIKNIDQRRGVCSMEKISVCGKGGSGKSTVVVLLTRGIRERGYQVLVVDSDESNPGL
jgi:MinD-like ATPase involved in chromosome partitioning or flagellar assembly